MTTAVVVGGVCVALVLVGAALALRWGGRPLVTPWSGDDLDDPGIDELARRLLWHAALTVYGAIAGGLLVVGPGGRLVMRLLAVTAGDAAQGRLTEADEVVGVTTVGGTIGFVVFVGMFGGIVLATTSSLLRRWLPHGRGGALAAGALFTVVLSTRLEPLRPDNEDFGLVGPGWLAIATFLAVGALAMLTIAAVMARLSSILPVVATRPAALLPYAVLVLALPFAGGAFVLLVFGAIGLALSSRAAVRRAWADPMTLRIGRGVLAAVGLAFTPSFVSDLASLL